MSPCEFIHCFSYSLHIIALVKVIVIHLFVRSLTSWSPEASQWCCPVFSFPASFLVCSSLQIQAKTSKRIQREVSITFQICDSTRERPPAFNFPLHPGGSATNTFPFPIQVPIHIKIALSFSVPVPVLGRTQVRRTLGTICSLL